MGESATFRSSRVTIYSLCVGCAAVFGVWAFFWKVLTLYGLDDAARLGDSFGAFNALVSGLAFIGVVYAILQQNHAADHQARGLDLQLKALLIQQEDLSQQLEEMRATRDEMKRHAEAAERQVQATLKLQRAILLGSISNTTMQHFHLVEGELETLHNKGPAPTISAERDRVDDVRTKTDQLDKIKTLMDGLITDMQRELALAFPETVATPPPAASPAAPSGPPPSAP